MALSARVLADTRRAFDRVAPTYGDSNESNPLLREMRARTLAAVYEHVPGGAHILDLGCGPGTDDERLGRSGYRVTGIDWSPEMVGEARQRVERHDLADRVAVYNLGIHELDRLSGTSFDAALSNFGPLNCVAPLDAVAGSIAARLRPGGVLIASVIGRVCPWEIALYLCRGQLERALVRFKRGFVPVPLNGGTVWTRYYRPVEFERSFAIAGFSRVSLQAMGLFSPPPYLEGFATRHPRMIGQLQQLDERLGAQPPFRAWGDHFLIVLRKG